MKFILQVMMIALAGYFAELVFPWWTVAGAAFLVMALLPDTGFKSFLCGFLGIGLLWFLGAMYFSIHTDYILTEKVADLMQLERSGLLIVLTALVGGIVGGMGALSGTHLHRLLQSRRNRKGRFHSSY